MEIVKIVPDKIRKIVPEIVEALKNGEILIMPTDTVYGLVCDATNKKAVEKIFKIKKRPKIKPLAIFVKDIKMAGKYAFINKKQVNFLKKNWPGATTIVLKSKNNLPKGVVAKNKTIGIRIPDYKLLGLILKKINHPIAQTSANVSGNPATTKIKEVLEQFAEERLKPGLVINAGNLPMNSPSTIINLAGNKPKILRK